MPGCIIRQGLWERFPFGMYEILSLFFAFLFFLSLFFLSRMCVIAYTSQDIPWICFAVFFSQNSMGGI